MIVIRVIPVSQNPQDRADFEKSLGSNAANRDSFVVIEKDEPVPKGAELVISLPDNCLILSNSWDKYLIHTLEKGLPKGDPERPHTWPRWEDVVKRRMGLTDRRHHGIFPELEVQDLRPVKEPVATT